MKLRQSRFFRRWMPRLLRTAAGMYVLAEKSRCGVMLKMEEFPTGEYRRRRFKQRGADK
jgi:hypothetical protein